jgi:hypothetical protein
MGRTIKGQAPYKYRPSTNRRPSSLAPVNESRENAMKRWNKVRQYIKSVTQLQRNIRAKGVATRGRFRVKNSSPVKKNNPLVTTQWKNSPAGIYFMGPPRNEGRFRVTRIHGFVPFPNKRTNAKSP